MLIPDANVLIYATNRSAAQHDEAKVWLEDSLSGTESVGFAWVVLLAMLRITTRRGLLERPLSIDTARGLVDLWLSQSAATTVVPQPRHWETFSGLISESGTGGNLTTDAHLAALAIEHRACLVTFDRDFARFSGLTWRMLG